MREPIIAGQFYEEEKQELLDQIKECFGKEVEEGDKKIYGVIAPHAGYTFSGKCQAKVYDQIAKTKENLFVVVGVNHQGSGNFISLEDWKTPLGIVKVDKEYGKEILEKCNFLELNNERHEHEHSVEIQLPFLQFIKKDFKIVPIILSDYNVYKELAKVLDKGMVIASSDFTHYGFRYGYVPFTTNVKENLYKLDKEAISFILKLDSGGFLNFVKEKKSTICGYTAILVAMENSKLRGAEKGVLLDYYTSGDITNYDQAVGYAGIVFI